MRLVWPPRAAGGPREAVKRPNDGLSVESRQALNTFRNLAVRTTSASKSGLG